MAPRPTVKGPVLAVWTDCVFVRPPVGTGPPVPQPAQGSLEMQPELSLTHGQEGNGSFWQMLGVPSPSGFPASPESFLGCVTVWLLSCPLS